MVHLFTQPALAGLYLILSFAVIGLWVRPLLGVVLGCAAIGFAFYLERLAGLGAIWLLLTGALIFTYHRYNKPELLKALHFLGLFTVCYLFYLHFMPGIYNWLIIENLKFSHDSLPYRQFLNVDKICLSVFLLAFGITLSRSKQDWRQSLRTVWMPLIVLVVVLAGMGITLHYVRFDPKLPQAFWLWTITNLLFVCVAEESLCRGFLQTELQNFLKHVKGGQWIAVCVAALAFGGLHYTGGPIYIALSTIAGLGYGYAYLKSKRIESAIILHFLVNLIHILLFSYPMLRVS